MNGKGFIKLPRSLLNEWRDILTPEEIGILVNLMAMANYDNQPRKAPKGDQLQRGQLVTSIRSFAKRFGISESKTRRLLAKWEKAGLIKRRTYSGALLDTHTGTLLTLEFYASSQGVQHSNRRRNQHEVDTPIRIEKKDKKPSPVPATDGRPGEAKPGRNQDDAGQRDRPRNITFTR